MSPTRRAVVAVILAAVAAVSGCSAGTARNRGAKPGNAAPHQIAPQAPGTDGSTATADIHAAWITAENQKPGTAEWRLTPHAPRLDAYADAVSATVGDTVTLYASTKSATFDVRAYRMGNYGGLGARLVWTSPSVPGARRPEATKDPVTNMIEARWEPSTRFTVDRDWPPGEYVLKLHGSDGDEGYVPLTVRDDKSRAALVFVNGVATWQAYNRWGGYNLYQGPRGLNDYANRSRVVSFDRPYDETGAGGFLGTEFPLVFEAEGFGLDITYATDVDLQRRPELLKNHRGVLTGGHSEYWSTGMRDGLQQAVDAGVNVAFFGANAIFRHIRYESSPLGADRRIVDYKEGREDPLRATDKAELTVNWREPPLSKPEARLIGEQYECNPVKADMVVTDPTAWVFDGTGLDKGSRLKGVVGPEYDRYAPGASPAGTQLFAHSPVRCHGRASYSDMTYYSAPSGAGVLATGTNWWIPKLPQCTAPPCADAGTLQRITKNILEVFATGPAGRTHPSTGASASLPEPDQPGPSTTLDATRGTTGRPRRSTTTTTTVSARGSDTNGTDVIPPDEGGTPDTTVPPVTTSASVPVDTAPTVTTAVPSA